MPNGRTRQEELTLKYGTPVSPRLTQPDRLPLWRTLKYERGTSISPFPYKPGRKPLYRYYDPRVGSYILTPIPPPPGVPAT
jgi:hypothetical protein